MIFLKQSLKFVHKKKTTRCLFGMKIFVYLALALLLVAGIFAAPEDATPGVLDITSANKESVFDGSKNVLVEFYAPCLSLFFVIGMYQ